MQTPNPLPEPGAWLVMPDGSLYEVVCPEPVRGEPLPLCADTAGVYYASVDSGEVIWTPWADVEWCGTYDEAESVSDRIGQRYGWSPVAPVAETGPRIVGQLGAHAIGAPAPRIAHTTRWAVTIYHAPDAPPPAYLRGAVRSVIQAALRAAGLDDAAVLVDDEATE